MQTEPRCSSLRNPRFLALAGHDDELGLADDLSVGFYLAQTEDDEAIPPEETESETLEVQAPTQYPVEMLGANPDIAEVMMSEIQRFDHVAPSSHGGIPSGYADCVPHLHSRKFFRDDAEEELTD